MVNEAQLQEFAKFAGRLTDAGSTIIRDAAREPFQMEIKGDGSPVTSVDKAVEDRIRGLIADEYPDHGILGEERGATASDNEFVWVIDPIDGTLPFLSGIPVFGILLALVHNREPVLGVIEGKRPPEDSRRRTFSLTGAALLVKLGHYKFWNKF